MAGSVNLSASALNQLNQHDRRLVTGPTVTQNLLLLMAALWNRAGHYIFMLWFLSSPIYLFPCLISAVGNVDVYHTSTHGVAVVRI